MSRESYRMCSFALRITLAPAVIVAGWGCSHPRPLVLSDTVGTHQLEYDCNDIKPHAESVDEVKVIMVNLEAITKDLLSKQKLVTLQHIARVAQRSDIRGLERIVVQYKCTGGNVIEEGP